MLRLHCTDFRLLDPPLELREMIYGMAFEKTHDPRDCDCEHPYGTYDFNPSQVMVVESYSSIRDTRLPRRTGNPTLLHVSRQVRSEAGKVYYRSKQSRIFSDVHMGANPEREVNTWLQTVVGGFATHLRDLTVHITYDTDTNDLEWAQIRAQYRGDRGPNITGVVDDINKEYNNDEMHKNAPMPFVGMPAYISGLEKIRAAHKEQREIIVDFFSNWDELRQACSGPDDDVMYLTHGIFGRYDRFWVPKDEATVE
jgi:hypothetical protein